MKKTLTAMTLLAGAVSVYSQGAVSMSDYAGTSGTIQVFLGQSLANSPTLVTDGAYSGHELMGNNANSYNPGLGTTTYATTFSGGAVGGTLGAGYDVGLLGAQGTIAQGNYAALSLAAGSVVSTWKNTSANAANVPTVNNNYGFWTSGATATVPGVNANGSTYTIAIAAWANTGASGAATTLAQAQADGYAWGVSDMVTTSLATGTTAPGFLPTGASGLTDFSLIAASTPEPSTIALGVIGASAFLFRRRK
jgi:hypothetical protein